MITVRNVGAARLAGALLLGAVVLSQAGCRASEAEEQTFTPEIAKAEQRTLDIRAEAAGLVEPIATVEIKSKASGEVLRVHVESGQEVTRGTLLAEIETRDVQNAFAQADADLGVAQARAKTADAQFARVQELRRANVATEQELEGATLEQANARAALVKARTSLELSRERLNDVTIRAPMEGMIIEKTVEPGAIIASASNSVSGGATLMKMADLSIVQVRALIDQTDIGRVHPGLTARVSVEAYPGRSFDGEVVKIEPQAVVEQNVTMFPVLIRLNNEERLLKPGMNTEIEIDIARRPNAVVIPNDAVVSTRDVVTTGVALGLSQDESEKRAEAMRQNRTNNLAQGGAPTGGQAEKAATSPSGGVPGPEASASPNSAPSPNAAATTTPPSDGTAGRGENAPSAECQSIMARMREIRETGRTASEDERAKQRQCFQQMGGGRSGPRMMSANRGRGGGGGRGGPGGGGPGGGGAQARAPRASNRPGVVFVPTPNGPEPRQITLGYSDLDFTEVVSGLKADEQVYLVTAARLLKQQQENLDRMRQRMQGPVPGMGQPGGGQQGRGPGGGRN
ncbi:MAG: efflux RND transporter periplasmic adaptor subunit [Longimicrobiales bacterium]